MTIVAHWYDGNKNWGDILNETLIEKISGQDVIKAKKRGRKKYLVIGSIIHHANDNSIVWGAGMISPKHLPTGKPKFLAVRGPLTRSVLVKNGHICPEIYGDPALLYPKYYNPKIDKKHKIGIVPHYMDKKSSWIMKKKKDGCKIIDVQSDINEFVDDICSCEVIISSSLHGIIAADAYGIPGYRIKLSDNLIGGDFKFNDYFASVGRKPHNIIVNEKTTIKEMTNEFYDYNINLDLDVLLKSCPFNSLNK